MRLQTCPWRSWRPKSLFCSIAITLQRSLSFCIILYLLYYCNNLFLDSCKYKSASTIHALFTFSKLPFALPCAPKLSEGLCRSQHQTIGAFAATASASCDSGPFHFPFLLSLLGNIVTQLPVRINTFSPFSRQQFSVLCCLVAADGARRVGNVEEGWQLKRIIERGFVLNLGQMDMSLWMVNKGR